MQIGKRIIFDKHTGKVLNYCLEEMEGVLQEGLRPTEIDFIDLPFGYDENNFKEAIEYQIDVSKIKESVEIKDLIIITKYIERELTEEEKRIKELENQLILSENNNVEGGIF